MYQELKSGAVRDVSAGRGINFKDFIGARPVEQKYGLSDLGSVSAFKLWTMALAVLYTHAQPTTIIWEPDAVRRKGQSFGGPRVKL